MAAAAKSGQIRGHEADAGALIKAVKVEGLCMAGRGKGGKGSRS